MPELSTTALSSDGNLEAYYRMESGALTTDSSGNSKTLTNLNTVGTATGQFGDAADFGAANTNKALVRSTNIFTTTQPSQISSVMWVKLNAEITTGTWRFFEINTALTGNINDGSFQMIEYQYNSGTRRLRAFNSLTTTAADAYYNITLGTSEWYHLAAINNGTSVELYVNGTSQASNTGVGANRDSGSGTYRLSLGANRNNNGQHSSILMDDAAFFNDSLTPSEVSSLYNDALARRIFLIT